MPPVIATPPAAASVVSASDAAAKPASAIPAATAEGVVDLSDARRSFEAVTSAAAPAPPPAVKPRQFVAVCPIVVGGEKGRVEPGQPYQPTSDAERDLFLKQGVIRDV